MKKGLRVTLGAVSGLSAMLALLLLSLLLMSAMLPFYEHEYDKLGQAAVIGTDRQTLSWITRQVVLYLMGLRADLAIQAQIGGVLREVFNAREIAHMADCRHLFLLAQIALGLSALVAALAGVASRLRAAGKEKSAPAGGFLIGSAVFFGLLAALAVAAVSDFGGTFTKFHLLFFSNDLWLLDPDTDVLIQMVPEAFFVDISVAIAAVFAVLAAAAVAAAIVLWRKPARGLEGDQFTAFVQKADDGPRMVLRHDHPEDRPSAEEVFANMGLPEPAVGDRSAPPSPQARGADARFLPEMPADGPGFADPVEQAPPPRFRGAPEPDTFLLAPEPGMPGGAEANQSRLRLVGEPYAGPLPVWAGQTASNAAQGAAGADAAAPPRILLADEPAPADREALQSHAPIPPRRIAGRERAPESDAIAVAKIESISAQRGELLPSPDREARLTAHDGVRTLTVPVQLPAEMIYDAEQGLRLEIRLVLQMGQGERGQPIPCRAEPSEDDDGFPFHAAQSDPAEDGKTGEHMTEAMRELLSHVQGRKP